MEHLWNGGSDQRGLDGVKETRRTKETALSVEWIEQGESLAVLPENDPLLAALYRLGIAVGYINQPQQIIGRQRLPAHLGILEIAKLIQPGEERKDGRHLVIPIPEMSPIRIMTRMRLTTCAAANL